MTDAHIDSFKLVIEHVHEIYTFSADGNPEIYIIPDAPASHHSRPSVDKSFKSIQSFASFKSIGDIYI